MTTENLQLILAIVGVVLSIAKVVSYTVTSLYMPQTPEEWDAMGMRAARMKLWGAIFGNGAAAREAAQQLATKRIKPASVYLGERTIPPPPLPYRDPMPAQPTTEDDRPTNPPKPPTVPPVVMGILGTTVFYAAAMHVLASCAALAPRPTPAEEYTAALLACVEKAETLAESQACRAQVNARLGISTTEVDGGR